MVCIFFCLWSSVYWWLISNVVVGVWGMVAGHTNTYRERECILASSSFLVCCYLVDLIWLETWLTFWWMKFCNKNMFVVMRLFYKTRHFLKNGFILFIKFCGKQLIILQHEAIPTFSIYWQHLCSLVLLTLSLCKGILFSSLYFTLRYFVCVLLLVFFF